MKRPAVRHLSAALALGLLVSASASAQSGWHAVSDRAVTGFVNPESVGCDVRHKVLYVGNFGSPKLDPMLKDGMGYISKVSLDGKILDKHFLPGPGGEKLNKPKGIWIQGDRLWTTDIDGVWIFDLKTRKGRKVMLPGIQFANDPAVMDGALYVSDNRGDQLYKVQPADFLHMKGEPKVDAVFRAKGVNPNGVYPGPDGMLLMVGFVAPDKPRGIYLLGVSGQVKPISAPIGRLDGNYRLSDGSLLVTDWNTGSFFRWSEHEAPRKLADGFKGPADFCVMPHKGGLTAYVPDLVGSNVRIIEIKK
jgi:hypothetical protein